MSHQPFTGDYFQVGEVWESPKGILWKVVDYVHRAGKPKQAVMRLGEDGSGRKSERDWDGVHNWVMYCHADGTRTDLLNAFYDLGDSVVHPDALKKALESRDLSPDAAAALVDESLRAGLLIKAQGAGIQDGVALAVASATP